MTNSTCDEAASDVESWTATAAHPPFESVDRALQLAFMLRYGGALVATTRPLRDSV